MLNIRGELRKSFTEYDEILEKNPGHDNQKVHGHRNVSANAGGGDSDPSDAGTTSDSDSNPKKGTGNYGHASRPQTLRDDKRHLSDKPKQKTDQEKTVGAIANEIRAELRRQGQQIYFGAAPYLSAMSSMDNIDDKYGEDSNVVNYFMANASQVRDKGKTTIENPDGTIIEKKNTRIKELKAELNRRLKGGKAKTNKSLLETIRDNVLNS